MLYIQHSSNENYIKKISAWSICNLIMPLISRPFFRYFPNTGLKIYDNELLYFLITNIHYHTPQSPQW